MARAGDPHPNSDEDLLFRRIPEIELSDDTEHKQNYENMCRRFKIVQRIVLETLLGHGSLLQLNIGFQFLRAVYHQLLSACHVGPQMTCGEQARDSGFHSYIVSSRTEPISSMLLASSTTDVQFYCQPEEQQCVLKNPGGEKNYLPCELDQAIQSKHPDANEILLGDTKRAHLRTIRHSEARHDPKIYTYALDMPQSRTPGDVGGSETSALILILDSGATHHAVYDIRILSNTHDLPAGMDAVVADGSRLPVTKGGEIRTPEFKIPGVHFVPALNMNLISVRQLAKNKIVTTFYENHAELWLEGTQIGGAILDESGGLYKLRYLLHDMK